jgi:hypothetical protein
MIFRLFSHAPCQQRWWTPATEPDPKHDCPNGYDGERYPVIVIETKEREPVQNLTPEQQQVLQGTASLETQNEQLRQALSTAQGEAYLGALEGDDTPDPLTACHNVIRVCLDALQMRQAVILPRQIARGIIDGRVTQIRRPDTKRVYKPGERLPIMAGHQGPAACFVKVKEAWKAETGEINQANARACGYKTTLSSRLMGSLV